MLASHSSLQDAMLPCVAPPPPAAAKRPRALPVVAAACGLLLLPALVLAHLSWLARSGALSRPQATSAAQVVSAQRQQAAAAAAAAAAGGVPSCRPIARFIPPLQRREDIGALLQQEGQRVGVELGVQAGSFAYDVLSRWSGCERFYLVDVWAPQQHYLDFANVGQAEHDAALAAAQKRLAGFDSKLVWLRNRTTDAVDHVAEQVDFVYVDARHDYCGALADIQAWWPRIRPGGIMAGHDFADALEVLSASGQDWSLCADGVTRAPGAVRAAVSEFFAAEGVQVVVTYREGAWNSWLARKPIYPCVEGAPAPVGPPAVQLQPQQQLPPQQQQPPQPQPQPQQQQLQQQALGAAQRHPQQQPPPQLLQVGGPPARAPAPGAGAAPDALHAHIAQLLSVMQQTAAAPAPAPPRSNQLPPLQ